MKKILGLDLGTNSIGWALVNEAQNKSESSSIIKLGVRVNPLTVDELDNFEKGKSITTNADRTLKRSMRRNLQRYKLRRENLIEVLKNKGFITEFSLLSENGNRSTFDTYNLRAKAALEEVSLEQFARILLMINKKRGYKSSRKIKSKDEGSLVDGMEIAKKLYEDKLTPSQYVLQLLKSNKKHLPDFYLSDLQSEFDSVWDFQKQFYAEILTDDFKQQIKNKGKLNTSKIFLGRFKIYTTENKGSDKRLQSYQLRCDALTKQLSKEELAFVISDLNGSISNSSGYLGAISDRSKELYFNKQTVGQYLMQQLSNDPHTKLKGQVFYRQDYLDEFNTIWEIQAKYHSELTTELKEEIRDIIIFYQRKLKSQKGLISFCEFENRQIEIETEGRIKVKTIGTKVCPKSSPLFQEFRIWQILNNIQVKDQSSNVRFLNLEEKEKLASKLNITEKMTMAEALKILFKNWKDLELNYKEIKGNRTQSTLYRVFANIIEQSGHEPIDFAKNDAKDIQGKIVSIFDTLGFNTAILNFNSEEAIDQFEHQANYQLWHLLYSFEGDDSPTGNEKLIRKISELYGFTRDYASMIASIIFEPDYGNLSTKAIRKILPFLKAGHEYSLACKYAGYNHSKDSQTKEELEKRILKDQLTLLPKNSLRNPVVEKILNQMINVVNTVIDSYGKPDEIRIELARDLKKSAKERDAQTKAISQNTLENENIKKELKRELGFSRVSKNDIIRYKLYKELEFNGFKTLYSGTYIPLEKLYSKDFDIEHIIPQSRLFDDSFSNKTLELSSINREKGNDTAYDFVLRKYGEIGLQDFSRRVETYYKSDESRRKAKMRKLLMKGSEIPEDFINRDLRDTQYISRKAKALLEDVVRNVFTTTGAITDRLRNDWQLVDIMQELNWNKYEKLGLTEILVNREGQKIKHIIDWTKRNDHRHHAMDALTISFTKPSHVQYLNNLNARSDKSGSIYGIEQKELYRDDKGKLKFIPPMPLTEFRSEAKKHLENSLVSIKAKNKVTTVNVNRTKTASGTKKTNQLTPRGQLHNETIYGSIQQYVTKEEKIGSSFTTDRIAKVSRKVYREALLKRLTEYENDPQKAFTGKNSLEKNPIYLNEERSAIVPERVKTVSMETVYTIRKEISSDLKLDKIVDARIRQILEERLKEYGGDAKKAFTNIEENPIWINKEKGIDIKRVTITGISNAEALHEKRDKEGRKILDKNGYPQPVDYVNPGNNHHIAIYIDNNGNLQEKVVSFLEATTRINMGLPIIDKELHACDGWKFLFSMKQNEYFVFPNNETGFNPQETDLMDPDNYSLISPNLFRVQKISSKNYVFNHHLETTAVTGETLKNKKQLLNITHKFIQSTSPLQNIIKVRINHIGQIVSIGEY